MNAASTPTRSGLRARATMVGDDLSDASSTAPGVYRIGDGNWARVPYLFRAAGTALPAPWDGLFAPLRDGGPDGLVVVAQIGQSLDGRIATASGQSRYINGTAGRTHLHRLRALVDAVVVGVGTALADDPQLTVRLVEGPHPARVVLDPHGRIPANARMLVDDGVRRVVVTTAPRAGLGPGVETMIARGENGLIAPAAILKGLGERGLRRILIEGGATTVSRFLAAGCLDRLHVLVAPVIIGAGQPGLALPPIDRLDGALRPPVRVSLLEDEVLFDCDLAAQRRRADAPPRAS